MKNVLLVHGYNGIREIFLYFDKELSNKGYHVIMPEFPIGEKITIEGYFEVFEKYREYFNEDLIVVAHSIGNPMLIKYLTQSNLKAKAFIGMAGFGKSFVSVGRDDLTKVLEPITLTESEKENFKNSVEKRFAVYSNNDHIVPLEILEEFPKQIDAEPFFIEGVGHMGSKSGIKELPQVIEIIEKINK